MVEAAAADGKSTEPPDSTAEHSRTTATSFEPHERAFMKRAFMNVLSEYDAEKLCGLQSIEAGNCLSLALA